ncbi:metallopeptidase [Faustovirus]|nr:metallopeptidase [Faustovirus]
MDKLVNFKLVEVIDYKPVFDRTVVKSSPNAIIVDHIGGKLSHIANARDESVWFWQQGGTFTGDLCVDSEFTHTKINGDDPKSYDPRFRCNPGDTYDIYWSTGRMVTIEILESVASMNFAEFSIKVIVPAMYKMIRDI